MKFIFVIISLLFSLRAFAGSCEAVVTSSSTDNLRQSSVQQLAISVERYCKKEALYCGYFPDDSRCGGQGFTLQASNSWLSNQAKWERNLESSLNKIGDHVMPFVYKLPSKNEIELYEYLLSQLDQWSRSSEKDLRNAVAQITRSLQNRWHYYYGHELSRWALYNQGSKESLGSLGGYVVAASLLKDKNVDAGKMGRVMGFINRSIPRRVIALTAPLVGGTWLHIRNQRRMHVPVSPAHMIHFDFVHSSLLGPVQDSEVEQVFKDFGLKKELVATSGLASSILLTSDSKMVNKNLLAGKKLLNGVRFIKLSPTPASIAIGFAVEGGLRLGMDLYENYQLNDDFKEALKKLETDQFLDMKHREELLAKALFHMNVLETYYLRESFDKVSGANDLMMNIVNSKDSIGATQAVLTKYSSDELDAVGVYKFKQSLCRDLKRGFRVYTGTLPDDTINRAEWAIEEAKEDVLSFLEKIRKIEARYLKTMNKDPQLKRMFTHRKMILKNELQLLDEKFQKLDKPALWGRLNILKDRILDEFLRTTYREQQGFIKSFGC